MVRKLGANIGMRVRYDAWIAVNTDAHMAYEIGDAPKALAMLEEIHFPEELIITRTRESFLEALRVSGVFTDNIIK